MGHKQVWTCWLLFWWLAFCSRWKVANVGQHDKIAVQRSHCPHSRARSESICEYPGGEESSSMHMSLRLLQWGHACLIVPVAMPLGDLRAYLYPQNPHLVYVSNLCFLIYCRLHFTALHEQLKILFWVSLSQSLSILQRSSFHSI